MSNKILCSFILIYFFSLKVPFAQQVDFRKCGHVKASQQLQKATPQNLFKTKQSKIKLDQDTKDYLLNRPLAELLTIPVVVHVVHNNGPENLTDAEIIDGIALLNEDFSAANEEIPNEIHPNFQNIVADVEVKFELACIDPDGLPTSGINRVVSNYTYAGDNIQMKIDTRWPREKYMNIWLVNKPFANSSSSGFAYYPSSVNLNSIEYDGVVIAYWAYGRHDQTSVGYEHVLSHEVGHWANLKHTWGDQSDFDTAGACDDDDEVADTPNTSGHAFYGDCTLETYSCGSLDNNNNFMDYTGTCTGMFTLGQKDRMRAAIESSVAQRSTLWSDANLAATLCDPNQALLLFNNTSIEEDLTNDGTINGTVHVVAQNTLFSQSAGTFTEGTHYTINGLPTGLSYTVTVTSNTTLEITVTGNSSPHENINDTNYAIIFTDAAFNGDLANNIIGSNYTNLIIDFLEEYRIECIDLEDPFAETVGQSWEYFSLEFGDAEFGTWHFGNDSLKLETYDKGAVCNAGTNHITPLPSAVFVGPSSTFTYPGIYPNQLDIANPSYTNWLGQTAYIGFEFESLGRTHYGWLRANVTANGTKFTVTDGAYNTEPFGGIYTGDCGVGVVPQLVYNPNILEEDVSNNGSFSTESSIILENSTFSQTTGNFTEGIHFNLTNLPSGLSVALSFDNNENLSLTLLGNADNHADINDTNFTITFLNAAFNNENALDVTNSTYEISLNFIDPYGIECIDLNDPFVEIGVQDWEYFSLGFGDSEFGTWIYDSENLKLETYGKGVMCYSGSRNIRPYSTGTSVGPNSQFTEPGAYPDQLDISNPSYTTWNGYTGYIGFRFSYNGSYHYGWLHASVNASGTSFTVLDGAYNTQPNAEIFTGDCSEPSLSVVITGDNPTCNNGADGSLTANVSNGVAPYIYAWSNGSITANSNNLTAGTYSLTVTDAIGASSIASYTLSEPSAINITTLITDATDANTTDGAINLTVSGGTAPYTFTWSNGAVTEDLSAVLPNYYSVTVVDNNGCSNFTNATVGISGDVEACDAITLLDYNWITNVSFSNINNLSQWDGNGYSDYTNQIAIVDPEQSYILTVNCEVEYWPDIAVSAWVDWNQDGDFYDPGEEVYAVRSDGPFAVVVAVPANAVAGNTILRVRLGYGTDLDPCGTDTYQGEVEDYQVFINPVDPPCATNLNITTTYVDGDNYQLTVSNIIIADNTIELGANIIYNAGIEICLEPGFEVQVGAEFEGKIDGCNNN